MPAIRERCCHSVRMLCHVLKIKDHQKHTRYASLFNAYAADLDNLGELPVAKPYYEEALEIRKAVLGKKHPDTALSLNNLGALLQAMGDLPAAKPYLRRST